MCNIKFSFLLFLFAALLLSNISYSQLSRTHYIPPLTYANQNNSEPDDQYIYISTPSSSSVQYSIQQIGVPLSNNIQGIVTNTNPSEISISNSGESQLFANPNSGTGIVLANKGYIITANDLIYVSIRVRNTSQAGAIVSKGISALGTSFRAGMFTNENPGNDYLNFIAVMATQNSTVLNFSNLPSGISFVNTSTQTTNITLNEGESYILATNSDESAVNRDGLIGTLIESDKPVVVNVGSANGSFHNGGGRDYGMDQIVGTEKIGSEYIFVKGAGENGWENALIVAHEGDTDISVNGAFVTTINAGDYYLIEGDQYNTNGNMYVQTSKNIFAYQGVGANNSEANQGMFFVPPLSCENRGNVDNIPNIESIGTTTFEGGVNIVTNTGATILINDVDVANFSTLGPFSVDGNPDYVTYKVSNLSDNISVKSDQELYCAYFNENGAATSGAFYSGFPSNPEVNFNVSITTLGNCIGNDLTLEAANLDFFDEFVWFYDDLDASNGTDYIDTGIKTAIITPLNPGKYILRASIDCTGALFDSNEILVSICPSDYDDDGIIDNIDQDIDNDGIINCNESIGDVSINLTNSNTPIANNTNVTATISGTFSKNNSDGLTNTFSGSTTGSFTSTAAEGILSSNSYTLTFSEEVNLQLTQNTGTIHTYNEKESFVLRLTDPNKNITLINPDGNLVVDTNFDDIYESGITQYSATEIRFQFSPINTSTTYTYSFFAHKVNEFIYEHTNNESTEASTFNGNISLKCYQLDSDGDTIEDALDLDSDNDGIPDLFELIGQNVVLIGTDANNDGVDDAIDAVVYLDSDNDGIFNFLDLDSDNDGIFDSTEAGHNLDNDFNGVVDNANRLIGTNGLVNNLENSDTGKLDTNFTVLDTDNDIFIDAIELDADNDTCFDVFEASFTDDNNDGILDTSSFAVDINGKVINNLDGYSSPNTDYITPAPIELNVPFDDVTFCENDTQTITIDSNADRFTWFVSINNGTTFTPITNNTNYTIANNNLEINNTPLTFNSYQYKVILEKIGNACPQEEITTLTVNALPTLRAQPVTLKQCATSVSTVVNLTEAEISIIDNSENFTFSYFALETDARNNFQEITDPTTFPVTNSANVWVRTTNSNSCFVVSEIEIFAPFVPPITYNTTIEACDDVIDNLGNNSDNDGVTSFNFTAVRQSILSEPAFVGQINLEVFFYETALDRDAAVNEIPDITNHRNVNSIDNQTIFVKIKNTDNNDCEGIGQFNLIVNSLPEFSVTGEAPDTPQLICLNNTPLTLEAENPLDTYSYVWTNQNNTIISNKITAEISSGGNYTVTATNTTSTCTRSRTITVEESNVAPLDDSLVFITDDTNTTSNTLSIKINVAIINLNPNDFTYTLFSEDNQVVVAAQNSHTFNNLEGGVYRIVVENKDSCGASELIVPLVQFPKFITPNGDGKNDFWFIKGASTKFYASATIQIFDRFGKLLDTSTINSLGWNGLYNGKPLPPNDYWYKIELIPLDTSKSPFIKTGHFSLIRE